jgi:hypothetical protein
MRRHFHQLWIVRKMTGPIALTFALACLFALPAGAALTAMAQPHAISIDEVRVNSVQPVADSRRHYDYRARCDYRRSGSRNYCRPQQKPSPSAASKFQLP